MFGKKQEPQTPSVTINSENSTLGEDLSKENNNEETKQEIPKEELTIQDILVNHESRLRDIEAALYRLKGAI